MFCILPFHPCETQSCKTFYIHNEINGTGLSLQMWQAAVSYHLHFVHRNWDAQYYFKKISPSQKVDIHINLCAEPRSLNSAGRNPRIGIAVNRVIALASFGWGPWIAALLKCFPPTCAPHTAVAIQMKSSVSYGFDIHLIQIWYNLVRFDIDFSKHSSKHIKPV